MKRLWCLFFTSLAVIALSVVIVLAILRHNGDARGEIRNLAKQGVSEQVLLSEVEKSRSAYKLSADEIIALKKDGVPERVIAAMLDHHPGKDAAAQQH